MTKEERRKMWDSRIAEYRSSGQSVKEWCTANNIKPERMWYWLRRDKTRSVKHKTPSTQSTNQATQWLAVEVSQQSPKGQHASLVLIRIGEACIEVRPGFDPSLLSQIVRLLTTLC